MPQISVRHRSSGSSNDIITMTTDYDLVIIGTGAAGTSAAATAVHMGATRVAMVERGPLWGTCVNAGCIPSKFLLTIAGHHYHRNNRQGGTRAGSRFDLGAALAGKNALIERLKEKKKDRFLDRLGIELVTGEARFLSPGRSGSVTAPSSPAGLLSPPDPHHPCPRSTGIGVCPVHDQHGSA